MKTFCNCLNALIKEKGVTQRELHTALGLSKNQIHYWLKGRVEPDLESLAKIAIYFEVSTDYLLGLVDEFGNPKRPIN